MKKIVTFTIALAPVLLSYKSPIPELDCFSLMIVFLWICHIISGRRLISSEKNYLTPLLVYILLVSPICFLAYTGNPLFPESGVAISRWLKFLVLCTMVSFTLIDDFDLEYGIKVVKWFVFFSTAIVIIQRLAFSFNIVIRNPLSAIAVNEVYALDSYTMELRNGLFRPAALFLEPAHLSQYFVVFIIYSLFSVKRSILNAIIASVGVIATGSGMGLLLVFVLFFLMIVLNIRHNPIGMLSLMLVFVAISIYLFQTQFFQMVIYRVLDGSDTGGNAIEARSGAGYLFFMTESLVERLFGHGYGSVPLNMYLNGTEYSLISIGFIGTILFCIVSARLIFAQSSRWKIIVWLFYFLLLFAAQLFASAMIYFYAFASKSDSDTSQEVFSFGENNSIQSI